MGGRKHTTAGAAGALIAVAAVILGATVALACQPTSIITTLSATSVAVGSSVHDTAKLTGTEVSVAGGTVAYDVYSDSGCTRPLANLTPTPNTVVHGVVPNSASYVFSAVGTFYFMASYSGDNVHNAASKTTCGAEVLTVTQASPGITTQLSSASIPVGSTIHDSATLSGATSTATGSVTFSVYATASCSDLATPSEINGQPSGATVSGNGTYNSGSVTFDQAGTYYWAASYGGDTNNKGATSTCNQETVTVTQWGPTITTQLSSASIPVGSTIHDSATLSGATSTATGSVTFSVYATASCSDLATPSEINGQPSGATVSGNGTYNSGSVTFDQAGTYYWAASYGGDTNNKGATSTCNQETVTVTQWGPTITTQLSSASIPVGSTIHDSATLSGATSTATGSVTFSVYATGSCSDLATPSEINGQPSGATVSGNGTYNSGSVTFDQAGTYYWAASYGGDTNNQGATSTCNLETVIVTALDPTITTQLSSTAIPLDSSVHDTATLSGATPTATGTVTFTIYTEKTCTDRATTQISGQPVAVPVSGRGSYASGSVSFDSGGTYYWEASYSGDTNNKAVTSPCTAETLVVDANTTAIGTQTVPSSPVAVGTAVHDTASLTGATADAGGTVSYSLYSDSSCSTLVTDLTPTDHTVVNGVVPNSNPYTFTTPGTWYFQVDYSGDANNLSAQSGCVNEALAVQAVTSPTPTPTGGVKGITTPGTGAGPSPLSDFVWTLGTILVLLGGVFLAARRRISTHRIEDV